MDVVRKIGYGLIAIGLVVRFFVLGQSTSGIIISVMGGVMTAVAAASAAGRSKR